MNFIETIAESFKKCIDQATNERPYDIENYCIGSGSNFEVHKNISSKMAEKIYEEYKKKRDLVKPIEKKEINGFTYEKFNTMESQSGYTYSFMFPISNIIEYNPNNVIDEWVHNKVEVDRFFLDMLCPLKDEDREDRSQK